MAKKWVYDCDGFIVLADNWVRGKSDGNEWIEMVNFIQLQCESHARY